MGSGDDNSRARMFHDERRADYGDVQVVWTGDSEKANMRQIGGEHYKTGKSECWDIVADHKLDYFQGQILRYVMRWNKKNGVEDLKKAEHFLQKYIELIAEGRVEDPVSHGVICPKTLGTVI